jgi:hypothetical protein
MTPATDIDTTLVECPEGCEPQHYPTTREFEWIDGGVGRRNYCRRCGTELVEADEERDPVPL